MTALVLGERTDRAILLLRGHTVMLDADLAQLYGVETKALNRAVKRNLDRFPADFMFQSTPHEAKDLRCHPGTSSLRYNPALSRHPSQGDHPPAAAATRRAIERGWPEPVSLESPY